MNTKDVSNNIRESYESDKIDEPYKMDEHDKTYKSKFKRRNAVANLELLESYQEFIKKYRETEREIYKDKEK
jgi:hypothetical protein